MVSCCMAGLWAAVESLGAVANAVCVRWELGVLLTRVTSHALLPSSYTKASLEIPTTVSVLYKTVPLSPPESYLVALLGDPHVPGGKDHLVHHVGQQAGDGEKDGRQHEGAALEHAVVGPVHALVSEEITIEKKKSAGDATCEMERVPDGVEELRRDEGDVLVERVLDQRGHPHVVPVAVHQQQLLQKSKLGEGEVGASHRLASLLAHHSYSTTRYSGYQ
ncbi:hypothetical protein E2C01_041773 [Portunus trituberculatus]|uniref:Uncharacterized protein n=1 Tax=Portunus trituberculatus TaxID=210409 RepID=A0A5B7FSR0_PORTR|nr:hypothetical protein [Portunus trituberculatus]